MGGEGEGSVEIYDKEQYSFANLVCHILNCTCECADNTMGYKTTYCIDGLQIIELCGMLLLLFGAHLLQLLHTSLILLRQLREGYHARLEGPEQDCSIKRLYFAVAKGTQPGGGVQLRQLLYILV